MLAAGADGLGGDHVRDGLLEGGGDVRARHLEAAGLELLHGAGDGGLQPGEGPVVPVRAGLLGAADELARGEPAREAEGRRVALGGEPVDHGAPGVARPDEAGDLVVRLAGRVVDGRAQQLDLGADPAHAQDLGVPAGDQQRAQVRGQVVPLRGPHAVQHAHAHVRHEVVDAVEGRAEGRGQRLRPRDPHHERARQTRAGGDGDRVEVREGDVGGVQGAADRGHEGLEVGAGGDLRDHAAEAHVLLHGGGDLVGQQGGAADDADAGLVAGGLDAEHEGGCGGGGHGLQSSERPGHRALRMITASSPPG